MVQLSSIRLAPVSITPDPIIQMQRKIQLSHYEQYKNQLNMFLLLIHSAAGGLNSRFGEEDGSYNSGSYNSGSYTGGTGHITHTSGVIYNNGQVQSNTVHQNVRA